MPELKEHCNECFQKLGNSFREVHIWLDEMAPKVGVWKHRKYRHHWEGIAEVRKLFGEEAGKAAELHIRADCDGIPFAKDYDTGAVDNFGQPKERSQHRFPI